MSLNVGDIVRYRRLAQGIKVGMIEEIYEIKDSIEKGRVGEKSYYVKVLNVEEKERVAEEDILNRYVEIVDSKFVNPFDEIEKSQHEFETKIMGNSKEEKEVPTIRLEEKERVAEKSCTIRLLDIFKAFEDGDTIIVNQTTGYCTNGEGVITEIDKVDFDQPFEVDNSYYINFDDINYVKINGKIYNEITLDLYVDEIIELSRYGLVGIVEFDECDEVICEDIEIENIENDIVYTLQTTFNLKNENTNITICCSESINSKKINILYR